MSARRLLLLGMLAACALVGSAVASEEVTAYRPLVRPLFTLDEESPEVLDGFFYSSDILAANDPNTDVPTIEISADGLNLGPYDAIDAICFGYRSLTSRSDTFAVMLSVDRSTAGGALPDLGLSNAGYPFNIYDQAEKNQGACDAFIVTSLYDRDGPRFGLRGRTNNNILVANGGDAGGVDFCVSPQGLSPSQANSRVPISDITSAAGSLPPSQDTFFKSRGTHPAGLFFSVTSGSPSLAILPGTKSGADIYVDFDLMLPKTEALYTSPAMLGLMPGDDIDALIVFENGYSGFQAGQDRIAFSLAPGSPSLDSGFSAADILVSEGFGAFTVWSAAAETGLAYSDNLNMLDFVTSDMLDASITDWAIGYPGACPGNVNGDGMVDLTDLQLLLSAYGSVEGDQNFIYHADANNDGIINLDDLQFLLAHYGLDCTSPSIP